ncbi:hypothetical protein A2U01_0069402, partial [Trifolium medium]|nr:hypothetical protein [Trifolium medium]
MRENSWEQKGVTNTAEMCDVDVGKSEKLVLGQAKVSLPNMSRPPNLHGTPSHTMQVSESENAYMEGENFVDASEHEVEVVDSTAMDFVPETPGLN